MEISSGQKRRVVILGVIALVILAGVYGAVPAIKSQLSIRDEVRSKEETLAILDKAQEAGLVAQPENTLRPAYICCCCGDCCGILTTVKKFPHPAELYATNYYAEVSPELCTGCETCVDKCQLEAITIVDGAATINLDRCIGCGACVANCEFNAGQLKKKEVETVPPENKEALERIILSKKLAGGTC